jgi:hypothetical protein
VQGEVVAQFPRVGCREAEVDQSVVCRILKRRGNLDVLFIVYIEDGQFGRAGNRSLMTKHLVISENARAKPASLLKVVRRPQEFRDFCHRRSCWDSDCQRRGSLYLGIRRKSGRVKSSSLKVLNYGIAWRRPCKGLHIRNQSNIVHRGQDTAKTMTLRTPAILLVTSLVMGSSLLAQPIFHDSSSQQVSFAAAEVGRALRSKRATPDRALRDLSSDSSSLRFAIAAGAAESKALPQTLRVAPMKFDAAQAYSIRWAQTGAGVTVAVLGADRRGYVWGSRCPRSGPVRPRR